MTEQEQIEKVVSVLYDNLHLEIPLSKEYLREIIKTVLIFDSKQQDYSASNISEFGEIGVLIRMNDKFSRLKNLLLHNKSPNHEKIEDTWMDISVYGIIGLLLRKNKWPNQQKLNVVK